MIFIQLCQRKNVQICEMCQTVCWPPLTTAVLPQHQKANSESGVLRIFSLGLFSMPNAGGLVLPCLLLCPQMYTALMGNSCSSTLPFFSVLCLYEASLMCPTQLRSKCLQNSLLCHSSSAGVSYPVQSSATSESL